MGVQKRICQVGFDFSLRPNGKAVERITKQKKALFPKQMTKYESILSMPLENGNIGLIASKDAYIQKISLNFC